MNQATKDAKVDLREKRHKLSRDFYKAGMKYMIALDEWIESQKSASKTNKELIAARERKQLLETFLHRLYPDEFADTSSGAE